MNNCRLHCTTNSGANIVAIADMERTILHVTLVENLIVTKNISVVQMKPTDIRVG